MMFKNDPDAGIFINKTMSFPAIEYQKNERMAFVKACISKDIILTYQKNRTETIKHALTHKRADDAFDELESDDMKLE